MLTPTPQRFLGRIPWGWLGLAAILLVYVLFLNARFSPGITEPDDNGYYAQGSLMATTGHTYFKPESNAQFIGIHWLWDREHHYFVSRYPPGFPVLIATVYDMFNVAYSYKAAVAINCVLSTLALVAFFMLVRRLTGASGWGLAAVIALATNPIFVRHALGDQSHMPVVCVLLWGMYFATSWQQDGKWWQVFLMGLLLGCIPTIRYADSIMGLGAMLFLICNVTRFGQSEWLHFWNWPWRIWVMVIPWVLMAGSWAATVFVYLPREVSLPSWKFSAVASMTYISLVLVAVTQISFMKNRLIALGICSSTFIAVFIASRVTAFSSEFRNCPEYIQLDVVLIITTAGMFALKSTHWYKIAYHYLIALGGALIPIVPLLIRNKLVLGGYFRTGYTLTNEDQGFSWAYFYEHWSEYIHQIAANGAGYLCSVGIVGIVAMMFFRKQWRIGLMLFLQVVAMFLVYSAYYWAPGGNGQGLANGTMRFLLPTFPLLILGATWAMAEATRQVPVPGRIGVAVVMLSAQLLWGAGDVG